MRLMRGLNQWSYCAALAACLFAGCAATAPASGAVTCDQLGNIALTTEQLRNQGNSLVAVLAEADKLEASDNLSKQDIARIKQVVEQTFKRDRTPLEIRQECKDAPSR